MPGVRVPTGRGFEATPIRRNRVRDPDPSSTHLPYNQLESVFLWTTVVIVSRVALALPYYLSIFSSCTGFAVEGRTQHGM